MAHRNLAPMMEYTITPGLRKNSKFYWIDSHAHIKDKAYGNCIALKCRYWESAVVCRGRAKVDLDANLATITKVHTCVSDPRDKRLVEVCE